MRAKEQTDSYPVASCPTNPHRRAPYLRNTPTQNQPVNLRPDRPALWPPRPWNTSSRASNLHRFNRRWRSADANEGASSPGERDFGRSVMSPDSLHRRTASSGSLADDDSMPDVGQRSSCPSSPASVDEPRLGPRPAASRTAGLSGLINRLNRQNLWPDTQDGCLDSALALAVVPQSPSDVNMPDLDAHEERDRLPNAPIHAAGETPMRAATHETPEPMSDLRGLTREQHLKLIRRSGPADRAKMLSLLADMMAKSDQCNVRRPSISRTSALRPTATTGPPSTIVADAPSAAAPSTSALKVAEAPKPMPASSRPPPPPPPLPAAGCGDMIEVDSAEEDDEDAWQNWQKGRETAALLRAAKAPAGIRKNGLARMHYTSQEVALRCPNVVMSKPRMRKRRKEAEDPAKASGRGGLPRVSTALPTPSATVPSVPSASDIASHPTAIP